MRSLSLNGESGIAKTVTSNSALHVVEKRLKQIEGLFC